MMNFVNSLAAMARGELPAGAARLSLPPRFAGPPASFPIEADEPTTQFDEPGLGGPSMTSQSSSPTATAARDHKFNSYRQPADGTATPGAPHPSTPRAQPPKPGVQPLPQSLDTGEQSSHDPGFPAYRYSPQRANHPENRAPQGQTKPASVVAPALERPKVLPKLPATASPEGRQSPLSEAAMASRAIRSEHQRSVVRVMIDRLEIRAQASQKPATEQRRASRPEPSVSLAEYLRGSGSEGRS